MEILIIVNLDRWAKAKPSQINTKKNKHIYKCFDCQWNVKHDDANVVRKQNRKYRANNDDLM